MSTITTLNSGDSGPVSRGVLNTNLQNLNTDKIETSVISTDGTLASNSDAKLPSEKAVKTYVDAQFGVSVETTTGVTHSLTTTAGQVVIVTVKGQVALSAGAGGTLTVTYGGVTKDTVLASTNESNSKTLPFALQYTETPGAATADIVVATNSGSIANVVIIVQIIG